MPVSVAPEPSPPQAEPSPTQSDPSWPVLLHATPRHGRLVLDTHVLLEALLWQSPRHAQLLPLLLTGCAIALRSEATAREWARVLRYPMLRLDATKLADAEARYVRYTRAESEPDPRALAQLPRCADRDDQKFLELAWHAGAHALLTRDQRLLKIGKHRLYRARFVVASPETWRANGASLWAQVSARKQSAAAANKGF